MTQRKTTRKAEPENPYLICKRCYGCKYLQTFGHSLSVSLSFCDYLLQTGHTRPDEPIARCSVRVHREQLPPAPWYFVDDVALAIGIAPGTVRVGMKECGIQSKRIEGFGQKRVITGEEAIRIARRFPQWIKEDSPMPDHLIRLRARMKQAARAESG